MKLNELKKIKKFCFGYEDIARALGISAASAKVAASRYTRQGILVRMKKNMYMFREAWNAADRGKIPACQHGTGTFLYITHDRPRLLRNYNAVAEGLF
jgi:hypothetical protein